MKGDNIKLDSKDKILIEKLKSYKYLAGVDEAGAGNWAGNLIVASVILDPDNPIKGLMDSKKLTMDKRFELYDEIIEKSLDYYIVEITPKEIDVSNILAMRMEGMRRSIKGLDKVDYAVIDGNRIPEGLIVPADYMIKGDAKMECISGASILAKVTVDKQMIEHDKKFPQYGFSSHKGYGTKVHREALEKYGACEIHRFSYKPIRELKN